jgi:L-idonate 5-dehydrogenase
VDAIVSGRIIVTPIITGRYTLDEAAEAFSAAADRSQSVKVHLKFDG